MAIAFQIIRAECVLGLGGLRKFLIILLLSVFAVVAACAPKVGGGTVTIVDDADILLTSSEGLTPDEKAELDRLKRYARFRAQGAGIGAGIGCATGYLAGGDWATIAAACGAGALIGYLGGAYLAILNNESVERRETLSAQLAAAQVAVKEAEESVDDVRTIVRNERRRIADLNAAYQAGRINQEAYQAELGALDARVEIVRGSLALAQRDSAAIQASIDQRQREGQNASELIARKRELDAQVRQLQGQWNEMVQAVNSIPEDIDAPAV